MKDRSRLRIIVFLTAAIFLLSMFAGCSVSKKGSGVPETWPEWPSKTPTREVASEGALIAFRRDGQIWIANDDGTDQRSFVEGNSPDFSPDGKTMAFNNNTEGYPPPTQPHDPREPYPRGTPMGIYSIPTEGGTPRLLTPASWLTDSDWSPLFPLGKNTQWAKRNCYGPSFSPDGGSICFLVEDKVCWSNGEFFDTYFSRGIATISADGNEEPRVIYKTEISDAGSNDINNPRFSRDGQDIYFWRRTQTEYAYEIDKIPADGCGALTPITPATSGRTGQPRYMSYGVSPVEDQIALVEHTEKKNSEFMKSMALMDIDNQRIWPVLTQRDNASTTIEFAPPSYSPSGETIAFTSAVYRSGVREETSICVILTSGGKPRKIIDNGSQPCYGRKASE